MKPGQKATLQTWVYAVPFAPTRADRIKGRVIFLQKETPVTIWRTEGETVIVGATYGDKTVLAPVNVNNVELV